MVSCNTTSTDAAIDEEPLFKSVTFHHVGLVLSALFALISVIICFFLMQKHATHYSKPWEQKHIIRIILMLPIYSTVSFLSYFYYQHAIYFEVARDCYEAFAIASFFTLLCHYIAPNLHDQKEYFRRLEPINWFWSVFGLQKCTGGQNKGILRKPRSGLTWFNVVWIGVFQYCFIRVVFTIVSVVAQAFGRYCESSLNPAFAHVWVMVIEGAAVTLAMFFLVQFYLQLKADLVEHRPFLKVMCIKLVIFFSFWQSLLISFLSSSGAISTTKKLASADINIGIPSMLLCIEMAIFAVMHLFAFPWREYDLLSPTYQNPILAPGHGYSGAKPEYQGGKFGFKAWFDAFNPWDIIKASARGFRWLFVGRKTRHHDLSYKTDSFAEPGTDIPGPHVTADNVLPATELLGRGRADTVDAHDDRAGLLSNAQALAVSPNPSRTGSYDSRAAEHEIGVATTTPGHVPAGPNYTAVMPTLGIARWDTDTEYHASPAAPSSAAPGVYAQGHVQQGQGQGSGQSDQWDHWAGARREQ